MGPISHSIRDSSGIGLHHSSPARRYCFEFGLVDSVLYCMTHTKRNPVGCDRAICRNTRFAGSTMHTLLSHKKRESEILFHSDLFIVYLLKIYRYIRFSAYGLCIQCRLRFLTLVAVSSKKTVHNHRCRTTGTNNERQLL